MKTLTLILLAITLSNCSVGKKEVKYSEMSAAPILTVDKGELIVKTENSKENSALSIFEIEPTIDPTNKVILLKGLQALSKEYRTDFRLKLDNVEPNDLYDYKIYWVDPDGKRTELRIGTKQPRAATNKMYDAQRACSVPFQFYLSVNDCVGGTFATVGVAIPIVICKASNARYASYIDVGSNAAHNEIPFIPWIINILADYKWSDDKFRRPEKTTIL